MKKKFDKFWWTIPMFSILCSILIAGFIVRSTGEAVEQKSYKMVNCTKSNASNFKCWKQRYEALVYNESPQKALVEVEAENDKGGYVRNNCHQLAHVIGRASAKKYDLNVANTFEQGNKFCASGYYHGAMETITAVKGASKIKQSINDICKPFKERASYKSEHYDCAHGLGHGVMSMENYELFQALSDCELLTDVWERESCATGVFMENIMGVINNPDYDTKYLKTDDLLYPCNAVADIHKNACYINQTSYALRQLNYDFTKMFDLCKEAGNLAGTCYQSLGRDASGSSIQDPYKVNVICQKGEAYEQKRNCLIGGVKDIIWIGNSKENGEVLCSIQSDPRLQQVCSTTAEEYYRTFL